MGIFLFLFSFPICFTILCYFYVVVVCFVWLCFLFLLEEGLARAGPGLGPAWARPGPSRIPANPFSEK